MRRRTEHGRTLTAVGMLRRRAVSVRRALLALQRSFPATFQAKKCADGMKNGRRNERRARPGSWLRAHSTNFDIGTTSPQPYTRHCFCSMLPGFVSSHMPSR